MHCTRAPGREKAEKQGAKKDSVRKEQKKYIVSKVLKHFKNELKGKTFVLWGAAFKANTDDIREAPALYVIDRLLEAGANIVAYDPEAMGNVQHKIGDKIGYAENMYSALENADVLIIVTEWPVFRTPDFDKLKILMRGRVIFDGRNVFDTKDILSSGFDYYSIGRQTVKVNS